MSDRSAASKLLDSQPVRDASPAVRAWLANVLRDGERVCRSRPGIEPLWRAEMSHRDGCGVRRG
jgi:hypothetical protein